MTVVSHWVHCRNQNQKLFLFLFFENVRSGRGLVSAADLRARPTPSLTARPVANLEARQ